MLLEATKLFIYHEVKRTSGNLQKCPKNPDMQTTGTHVFTRIDHESMARFKECLFGGYG